MPDAPNPDNPPPAKTARPRPVPSPKGTRDFYPDDLLRQRYITEAWRRVSIRHGFEEIAGPTFEMRELYTRKSGEGIVSELFSFRREGGDDDYALRPEFTPTLARMYAAKAASLPSPTKWFTAGPYFRAERPQRGRLREFLQWNCDVIGGEDEATADSDILTVLVNAAVDLGLNAQHMGVNINDRRLVDQMLLSSGLGSREELAGAYGVLDRRAKLSPEALHSAAEEAGLLLDTFDTAAESAMNQLRVSLMGQVAGTEPANIGATDEELAERERQSPLYQLAQLASMAKTTGLRDWLQPSTEVVRGLAYYTGTVFELIADGERAVAGGGRYDNLIELFGGPPTPAVGFGMGDVVLGLLLEDKNLMPEGAELRDALSQPPASLRPEAFVIADEDQAELVEPLLADLRRGVEAEGHDASKPWSKNRYDVRPLHARRSYKPKRKKQVQDAANQAALFTVTVDEPGKVSLKSMDTRQDLTPVDVPGLPDDIADFSVDPASPAYVGRAIANLLHAR